MTAPILAITRRIRSTPFSCRIEAFGVQAYTVCARKLQLAHDNWVRGVSGGAAFLGRGGL
jgi:hypothetical protein